MTPMAWGRLAAMLFAVFPQEPDPAAPRPKPLSTVKDAPTVAMFAPGFEVRELPVSLTNVNNVEYADDGRLFAAGYDGRLHVLRDTDGDGLEDHATSFASQASEDYPLGIAVRGKDLFILRRHAVVRHVDSDGDGVPDREEVAASGWRDEAVDRDPLMTHRRVDDALGLAIAPDGAFYVTMGAAHYGNGYMLDKEKKLSHLDLRKRRGCVLKIPPDGKNPEIVATGVRFVVSLQFNRRGDLFGTDQEGATWLPNGNPFDEFLHLEPGRHYGFPPRHPKHLPDVLDEPSVFDFGPQHQSTCGFRFNESRPGRAAFGPPGWEGDALVTAMSRGKLYRIKLAKTGAGYVARTELIAGFGMLPVDATISPRGDLVVACHGGAPDWGSGPKGPGKLFKVSWKGRTAAQPVFAYPSGPDETVVAFDRPLGPADWKDLAKNTTMESGAYVAAGDRFERFRPGYQVVKNQMKAPRWELPILSAGLDASRSSLVLRTARRDQALGYAVTLPGSLDLAYDLSGVDAVWTAADGPGRWSGWLPHLDLAAARAFTKGSADHDRLWTLLQKPGRLVLKTHLDLKRMLQPAVQEGSALDAPYPPEKVTVTFRSGTALEAQAGKEEVVAPGPKEARLVTTPGTAWIPVTLSIATGEEIELAAGWHTAQDPRPRALPLRRLRVPWARPADASGDLSARPPAEIAGGNGDEGKRLYFGDRLACGKCHAVRGEGGRIGPDLSNLVHRDYESVMKDLVQPSAAINPDHLAYTVKLKGGDVQAGVIVASRPEAIVLGTATGETVTVSRDKIEVLEPSKISLMPENLLKDLSPEQLRDLMFFLLTPPKR